MPLNIRSLIGIFCLFLAGYLAGLWFPNSRLKDFPNRRKPPTDSFPSGTNIQPKKVNGDNDQANNDKQAPKTHKAIIQYAVGYLGRWVGYNPLKKTRGIAICDTRKKL